jgi:hypothetical protein
MRMPLSAPFNALGRGFESDFFCNCRPRKKRAEIVEETVSRCRERRLDQKARDAGDERRHRNNLPADVSEPSVQADVPHVVARVELVRPFGSWREIFALPMKRPAVLAGNVKW